MSEISEIETTPQSKKWMTQAIELAEKGRGWVEPNPMVGCVIVKGEEVIGAGYHEKFGSPHAEVNALKNCDVDPKGSTVFVTLEPCCHTGKTPPCSKALIRANVEKVVVGMRDPFPKVDGGGIRELLDAGIEVSVGLFEDKIAKQNAGFLKRVREHRPWVIAKWAMTLDGKIATRSGNSQWISNSKSREIVHRIRGQVDAIIVGSGTALADDPMLNARLNARIENDETSETSHVGDERAEAPISKLPRIATRIVFDSSATLSAESKLCQTAKQIPVLLIVDPKKSNPSKLNVLREMGVEVYAAQSGYGDRVGEVLHELSKRDMTNVLIEGGAKLMGEFMDSNLIDEVNVFVAPKLIGSGLSPIESNERLKISDGIQLSNQTIETIGDNILIRGLVDSKS